MSEIAFNQISNSLRLPFAYTEFDNTNAVIGADDMPYTNLVFGQKLEIGEGDALKPYIISNKEQANRLFGNGSNIARMLKYQLSNNNETRTYAVAFDDAEGSVAAIGKIIFEGNVLEAGTINFYINGERVRIAVNVEMTLSEISTSLANAINKNSDFPLSAATIDEEIVLTSKNKGEIGNEIQLDFNIYNGESLPKGIRTEIKPMANGTANPDIIEGFAAFPKQAHVITMPYTDQANLMVLHTELTDRWGPMRMNDGFAIGFKRNDFGDLISFGETLNSPFLCIPGLKKLPQASYEVAAGIAGIVSKYGNIDPARPFQTLELKNILPPNDEDIFTDQENNLLLYSGISVLEKNEGGGLQIKKLITTYRKNGLGADDTSYLQVNTILTLSYLRFSFNNHMKRKFPRHKLANDDCKAPFTVTPKVLTGEAISWAKLMEEKGLIENIEQFKKDIKVERNKTNRNRADLFLPPDLVNQFEILATQIGFIV